MEGTPFGRHGVAADFAKFNIQEGPSLTAASSVCVARWSAKRLYRRPPRTPPPPRRPPRARPVAHRAASPARRVLLPAAHARLCVISTRPNGCITSTHPREWMLCRASAPHNRQLAAFTTPYRKWRQRPATQLTTLKPKPALKVSSRSQAVAHFL